MAGQHNRRQDPTPTTATQTIERAWKALPAAHRGLLRDVGCSQRLLAELPLGEVIDKLLRSAGGEGLSAQAQADADTAIAVWLHPLRLVIFNVSHPTLIGLSPEAYAQTLSHTAWHEWGHALSIVRCTAEDVREGRRLLKLAPTAVDKAIRGAGYLPSEYTYELVANVYAMLVDRRHRNLQGRPKWLHQEIYDLVVRVTGWTE